VGLTSWFEERNDGVSFRHFLISPCPEKLESSCFFSIVSGLNPGSLGKFPCGCFPFLTCPPYKSSSLHKAFLYGSFFCFTPPHSSSPSPPFHEVCSFLRRLQSPTHASLYFRDAKFFWPAITVFFFFPLRFFFYPSILRYSPSRL